MSRIIPRRWGWALLGALLSFGSPGGLFLLQGLGSGGFDLVQAVESIGREPTAYLYVVGSSFVTMVALGWALGRQADAAWDLARRDPLTGLLNRRAFDEMLALEFARSRRSGGPVALLLLDLDDLKLINDRYGHDAGDRALRRLAEILAGSVRSTDSIGARIGGDEFVILAPETSLPAALSLAERLRRSILAAPASEDFPPFTMSIGIVTLDALRHSGPASLLADADSALYEAKRGGRGRVATA